MTAVWRSSNGVGASTKLLYVGPRYLFITTRK